MTESINSNIDNSAETAGLSFSITLKLIYNNIKASKVFESGKIFLTIEQEITLNIDNKIVKPKSYLENCDLLKSLANSKVE